MTETRKATPDERRRFRTLQTLTFAARHGGDPVRRDAAWDALEAEAARIYGRQSGPEVGYAVMVQQYARVRATGETIRAGRYRATVEAVETRDGVPGVVLGRSIFHVGGGRKWAPLSDVERI